MLLNRLMINVFIDTSIFVSEGFVKGKSIATIFQAAQGEKIHILMPDITEHEIRCHLREEVEKNNGTKSTEKLKKSYMYAVDELRTYIEKLMEVTASALVVCVEKEFDRQLKRAHVERIALTKDLDFVGIVEDYKALKPPFSAKKNKEFPDAIVLKQLEDWCKAHNDKCIILSSDTDLKNYNSEWLDYKELPDFVESLGDYEKLISQEKLRSVFESSKDFFEKSIQDWAYEQYDDDTLYINHLLIEDIHGSYINKINIEWNEPFRWIGKGNGSLFYKTYAYITASIVVSHPDYDTGYYDSEDGRWFFIDEKVTDYLEGRIRVPVTLEYLYADEEMELESINNDADMSRAEVMESLVTTGKREYDVDEDFEIDHEVCPHCNAEVIVFEYEYVGNGGKREEIVCPKCHKVICTLEEAGFYRTELFERATDESADS